MPLPQMLPNPSHDSVGNGGRWRGRCGTPATASLNCSTQARYELHEATTELTKQRKEDEKGSVVVGRGEVRSGEVRPWKQWRKNGLCALPRPKRCSLGVEEVEENTAALR